MDEKRQIGVIGLVEADGSPDIPIYGTESINLSRQSQYELGSGAQAIIPITWNGTTAIEYQFNFELVAGVTVKDRATLFQHIKTAHAMASHTYKQDGFATGNPVSRLILGRGAGTYVNTKGFVKSVETNASGPYDREMQPTSCRFTGIFVIAPGYGAGLSQVERHDKLLSSKQVKSRLYAFTT